jgi:hypothetical protein
MASLYERIKTNHKIKIEFSDPEGAKYTFFVQGANKDNIVRLIDFAQSVSPTKNDKNQTSNKREDASGTNTRFSPIPDTNFARVCLLIEKHFQFGAFTSKDILQACHDQLGLSLSLPTISAYLARLAERRLLNRTRNGAGWLYRLIKGTHIETEQQEVERIPLTISNTSE